LWVAGTSRATLRRAARTGIWHPVALTPEQLRRLAESFDGRVVLRIGIQLAREQKDGKDERGRHALEGPPEWIAARLAEYIEAGCDGFVVNLGHEREGLEGRIDRFADEVVPLLAR
jgi:alkanesulfonate monooxygenase SsuD/methylene tetrahydromethanopterin reductase-like flavin-dependent oxidoreductase (luciferase family)